MSTASFDRRNRAAGTGTEHDSWRRGDGDSSSQAVPTHESDGNLHAVYFDNSRFEALFMADLRPRKFGHPKQTLSRLATVPAGAREKFGREVPTRGWRRGASAASAGRWSPRDDATCANVGGTGVGVARHWVLRRLGRARDRCLDRLGKAIPRGYDAGQIGWGNWRSGENGTTTGTLALASCPTLASCPN